jgi:GMP synthase-like glutamine amidotransferase
MKAHCLMNIGFEGPGYISDWMDRHGHSMQVWKLFENPTLPEVEDIDMLLVMGGPMNIYEKKKHPYLTGEKQLIHACIREHKLVLGICLGAQLIAYVLGEKVFKNSEKEMGWFPMHPHGERGDHFLRPVFPETFVPFHWHGETFGLPEGAKLLGLSAICRNQGFLYGDNVLALQFHLEITPQIVDDLLRHAADDLTPGEYVQSVREIREGLENSPENRAILFNLLDRFTETVHQNRKP